MLSRLLVVGLLFSSFVNAQFWTERASGFPISSTGLYRIHAVDDNVAWALGYDGLNPSNNVQRYTYTSDGGLTWNAGTIDVGSPMLGISNISGIDATTAYVAVHPRTTSVQGGVWKTVDSGTTWTQQSGAAFNSTTSFANAVHFFNGNDGVAIGDPAGGYWEIYVTTDGGTTYSRIPSSAIPAPQTNEVGYLAQYTFLNDTIWFTTSTGRIYRSVDKGVTWQVFSSPLSDFGGTSISGDLSFSTLNKGIIQDNSGNLYRTIDGGSTWLAVNVTSTDTPYGGAIAYIPNSTRLVSTGGDSSFAGTSYSTDDGITWTNVSTQQHIDVAFFDEDTGYSGSFSTTSIVDGVFVYSDSVLNIKEQESDDVVLYPNPTTDILYIKSKDEIKKLSVYDLQGRLVIQSDHTDHINFEKLPSGIYALTVTIDNQLNTYRIIKN